MFVGTAFLDPHERLSLLVSGAYTMADAGPLYREASCEGAARSHLQPLDGTDLLAFEHESVEKFFPDEMEAVSGRRRGGERGRSPSHAIEA